MGKRLAGRQPSRRQAFFWCVFRSCFVKRCRNNAAARTAGPRLNKKTVEELRRRGRCREASYSRPFPRGFFRFTLGHRLALTRRARSTAGPYLSGMEWFIVASSVWSQLPKTWIAVHRENHRQEPIHHLSRGLYEPERDAA